MAYGGRIREEMCDANVGGNTLETYKKCGKPATHWVEDNYVGMTYSCCDEHLIKTKRYTLTTTSITGVEITLKTKAIHGYAAVPKMLEAVKALPEHLAEDYETLLVEEG